MVITFNTSEEFFNAIAAMVVRGIGFNADGESLTITCTGAC